MQFARDVWFALRRLGAAHRRGAARVLPAGAARRVCRRECCATRRV